MLQRPLLGARALGDALPAGDGQVTDSEYQSGPNNPFGAARRHFPRTEASAHSAAATRASGRAGSYGPLAGLRSPQLRRRWIAESTQPGRRSSQRRLVERCHPIISDLRQLQRGPRPREDRRPGPGRRRPPPADRPGFLKATPAIRLTTMQTPAMPVVLAIGAGAPSRSTMMLPRPRALSHTRSMHRWFPP